MTRIVPVSHSFETLALRGTAYIPDNGETAYPTAVLHHGFGSNRLEAFGLFVRLSRSLAERGILAVAFDRAGQGESDGDFFHTTISGEIVTSAALLEVVAEWPEVDASSLHLVGMSMGSVIASIVAAESERSIASLTLLSPAAVFVDDIRAKTMQGRSTDEVAANGFFEFGHTQLGAGFFEDGRDFDVYGRAASYTGPVRIIHGDADEVVPNDYALRYGDLFGSHAEVTIVPGADHLWSGRQQRDFVLEGTVDFIERHVSEADT